MPIPGLAAAPRRSDRGPRCPARGRRSRFAESLTNQRGEGVVGLLSVGTHATQAEHASLRTREHKHPRDALPVHLGVVLADEHLGRRICSPARQIYSPVARAGPARSPRCAHRSRVVAVIVARLLPTGSVDRVARLAEATQASAMDFAPAPSRSREASLSSIASDGRRPSRSPDPRRKAPRTYATGWTQRRPRGKGAARADARRMRRPGRAPTPRSPLLRSPRSRHRVPRRDARRRGGGTRSRRAPRARRGWTAPPRRPRGALRRAPRSRPGPPDVPMMEMEHDDVRRGGGAGLEALPEHTDQGN